MSDLCYVNRGAKVCEDCAEGRTLQASKACAGDFCNDCGTPMFDVYAWDGPSVFDFEGYPEYEDEKEMVR